MILGLHAEEWPAISALLDEALALDPSERLAWLERLPANRSSLRESLRGLLTSDGSLPVDGLLSDTPPRFAWPDDGDGGAAGSSPLAGDDVGPYSLLRKIGDGGMGAVWLAEARSGATARRQVALKLPHAVGWGSQLAERMRREGEILATLEHPNIARLYDAGVDGEGRPYLAIEYVEGDAIDAWARSRALDTAARLALLLQVAEAVSYAHGRLVIHRDLKPANILVDATGRVHLLDFGIAKLLDGDVAAETALTQTSGRAMTLDYASPEQVRGEPLATASDVYSLGVVAYELLAGARPYRLRRSTVAALEEAIVSADIAPASTQASAPAAKKALRGDLDAILNKALKKDVAERYPNVDAFALDLRRHLANEPVAARPDRWSYRARKFAMRYRLQIGAASLVAAALLVGVTLALTQAARAERERAAAVAARETSEKSLARAEKIASFMQSMFSSAASDNGATVETRAVELLAQSRPRVATQLAGDTELQYETLLTIGESQFSLGDLRNSADTLDAALQIDAKTPIADRRRARIGRVQLAHVRALLGQIDEADQLLQPLLDPAGPRDEGLAIAQEVKSVLLVNRNQAEAAVRMARQSVQTWDAIRPAARPASAAPMASSLSTASAPSGAMKAGRAKAAEDDRALEEARRRALLTLARAEYHADYNEEALQSIDRALAQIDAMPAGAISATTRAYHVALRARILRDVGRLDEAADTYRTVLPVLREAYGARSTQTGIDLLEYAGIERRRGRLDEAIALFREALEIGIENKESPRNIGTRHAGLAGALRAARRHSEAAAEFAQSARDEAAGIGTQNPQYWAHRASASTEAGFGGIDPPASLRAARQAWDELGRLENGRSQQRYRNEVAVQIALLSEVCGETEAAAQSLATIPPDAVATGVLEPLSASLADVVRGRLALDRGDIDEAKTRFDAALAALPPVPSEALERGLAVTGLARVALRQGRVAAALRDAAEGEAIAARRAPRTRWEAEARGWHAQALLAAGQAQAGNTRLREAEALLGGRALPSDRQWRGEKRARASLS